MLAFDEMKYVVTLHWQLWQNYGKIPPHKPTLHGLKTYIREMCAKTIQENLRNAWQDV